MTGWQGGQFALKQLSEDGEGKRFGFCGTWCGCAREGVDSESILDFIRPALFERIQVDEDSDRHGERGHANLAHEDLPAKEGISHLEEGVLGNAEIVDFGEGDLVHAFEVTRLLAHESRDQQT